MYTKSADMYEVFVVAPTVYNPGGFAPRIYIVLGPGACGLVSPGEIAVQMGEFPDLPRAIACAREDFALMGEHYALRGQAPLVWAAHVAVCTTERDWAGAMPPHVQAVFEALDRFASGKPAPAGPMG